jgi:flagellum-specific peptidoglycan hydrolase FlgJ
MSLTPEQQAFVSSVVRAALAAKPGITIQSAGLLAAWACHESGWGKSNPARKAYNFWNVSKGSWTGPVIPGGDTEYVVGSTAPPKKITQLWRAYSSAEESIKDLFNFLEKKPGFVNYKEAAGLLMKGDESFATALGVLDRDSKGAIVRVDNRKGTAGFYTLPRKDYQKGVSDLWNKIAGFVITNLP